MLEELQLAERVAVVARGLGVETALIGATALAFHHYVRGTVDVDLAAVVHDPFTVLPRLEDAFVAEGLHAKVVFPDDADPLGGMIRVWKDETPEGDPIEPVELINFWNPLRVRGTPAIEAVRDAERVDGSGLRCVRLADLIALKCYAGGRGDLADVVALLRRNPDADRGEIRARCRPFQLDVIDELIAEADAP